MSGFPAHVIESAWGPNALANLRREALQLRHEAALVRDDGAVDEAAVLDMEAAEVDARIDSLDGVAS